MNIRDFIFKIFKGATVSLGCIFISFSFILAADLINKICLLGVGIILLIAVYLVQNKNFNIYVTLFIKVATLFLFICIFFNFGVFGILSYSLSFIGGGALVLLMILKIVDFFVYGNVESGIRNKNKIIDKIN